MKDEIIHYKMLGYSTKLMYFCAGRTYEAFAADTKLAEACLVILNRLGELSRSIGDSFAQAHPEVPWRKMYGYRIVHNQEGFDLRLVWELISEDIPALKDTLEKLAAECPAEDGLS